MLYYTMCFFASEEVRSILILVVLDDALVLIMSLVVSLIISLSQSLFPEICKPIILKK